MFDIDAPDGLFDTIEERLPQLRQRQLGLDLRDVDRRDPLHHLLLVSLDPQHTRLHPNTPPARRKRR